MRVLASFTAAFTAPFTAPFTAMVVVAACSPGTSASGPREPTTATAPAPVTNPCAQVTPVVLAAPPNLVMPLDFVTATQTNADCMAWQEFLYLNWAADPAHRGQPDPSATVASFGQPGALGSTVWESFFTPEDVFVSSGKVAAWNGAQPQVKSLSRLSELGDGEIDLGSIQQAGSDGWLTDQSGNLIFYEVHLNQDEYGYITGNALSTASGQTACATNPGNSGNGGFNLPAGGGTTGKNTDYNCAGTATQYGQNLGAIEIKAAWRVLPADGSLNYRYKIASAQLHLPDGTTQQATVGLIGLHIIHKVPSGAQFVWATFEQIDNDPDTGSPPTAPALPPNAPPTRAGYTLFNPNCNPATDTVYKCAQNLTLVSQPPPDKPLPPCAKGVYTPNECYPYWAPMQTVRLTPVKSTPNSVTGYAWSQMPAGSVFNYYRLIDVQWPATPSQIPPGATVPLSAGGITPASGSYIVANTTMETFEQNQASCMDCHQYASVAKLSSQSVARVHNREVRHVFLTRAASGQPSYASDYSFIFSTDTRH